MKTIISSRYHSLARIGVLLIMIALVAGMAGCFSSSRDLQIRTWYDLEAIRDNLSGHHTLMNDLNSTTAGYNELASPAANGGKGWHPIGGPGSDGSGPPFTGTFDGQGNEIRDLSISLPGVGYVGLFSVLGEGGRIEDVGVVNANISSTAYIGSLVGISLGTVSNSYSTGSVRGTWFVGGLVGYNQGTVSNSHSTGNVTSDIGAGSLVGANNGTVSNSYAAGRVTGRESAGGLLGTNNGTVVNSYSVGNVTGDSHVGGLVGYGNGTVSNSFWDVQTSGTATSSGGTGRTTVQMRNIGTFSAWNIAAVANPSMRNSGYIWNIVNNTTYPFLSWQPA